MDPRRPAVDDAIRISGRRSDEDAPARGGDRATRLVALRGVGGDQRRERRGRHREYGQVEREKDQKNDGEETAHVPCSVRGSCPHASPARPIVRERRQRRQRPPAAVASPPMHDYQRRFIDFMIEVGVLTFGDFTTKSGRRTPYFVNTGKYRSGTQLATLGRAYADAIERSFPDGFDCLFGPAYKGIPLAVAIAMAFAERGREVEFVFNRKEAKDHGEGGLLVGRKLRDGDRVLIVEDVTTAGTSIRETVPILRAAADIRLAGLVVSVDRQERASDASTTTALAEVGAEFGMPTAAIVTIDEVVGHLGDRLTADDRSRIAAYRERYGVSAG